MSINTSLQNKNCLPASKNIRIYPVNKGKNVLAYRPLPYNVYVYFLEGQVHKKESKSDIMTNVGKSYLCKHSQMSNACTDSFCRYTKWFIYYTVMLREYFSFLF